MIFSLMCYNLILVIGCLEGETYMRKNVVQMKQVVEKMNLKNHDTGW